MEFDCEPSERDRIYYDPELRQVMNARKKAEMFVEQDCIEYDHQNQVFIIHPLEGNSLTYTVEKVGVYKNPESKFFGNTQFECNCQWYQKIIKTGMADSQICSHIRGLYHYFRRQKKAVQGKE